MKIGVLSPTINKRHGTERCIAEQIERLAWDYGYEVHVYSQMVDDIELDNLWKTQEKDALTKGCIVWHRIPKLFGPHLFNYSWWFVANHLWRWWHRRVRGLQHNLVYSPGINCLDADVVSVHIVFARFYQRVKKELRLMRRPIKSWPRIIHRWLYYRLIMLLERLIYTRNDLSLFAISSKVAHDLTRFYDRRERVPVIYHGIDHARFNPTVRRQLRPHARQSLGFTERDFVLLLIGNDWYNKGLPCLIQAVQQLMSTVVDLEERPIHVLVVGHDDPAPFRCLLQNCNLQPYIHFCPPRPDVEFYYAAADAYVGPSLEDAFALPPAEAMACGLPVIVSRQAGVSEIISDHVDGLILDDPHDASRLAALIQQLYSDADLCRRLSTRAVQTAQQYTWERSAAQVHELFQQVVRQKRRGR